MTRIVLGAHSYGYTLTLEGDEGDWSSILVQSDYDYPGLASTFGWSVGQVPGAPGNVTCYHDGTDGSIDCRECGRMTFEFIRDARGYLDRHVGDVVEDPGYFMEPVPSFGPSEEGLGL